MSRRGKILLAVAALLGVVMVVPVLRHFQLRFAVANYLAELKARGEPMELAQVLPPPVPPEQNAAPLITHALSQIYLERNYTNSIFFKNAPYAMNRTMPGKVMIGWHQPVIHGPGTWPRNLTNTWADLGAQLAERQNDLNDFRKLIKKPNLDFNYDYSDSKVYLPALAPHLSQIKMAVQWLGVSEYYHLHENNPAAACMDVRAMLAFVKGQTGDRFEISQLIRCALASMSASATWNLLQTTNVSDEGLAQVQQDWLSLDFVEPMRKAFLFERFSQWQLLNDLRQSPANLSQWVGSAFMAKGYVYEQAGEGTSARWGWVDKSSFPKRMLNKFLIAWEEAQWRWFWSYTDQIRGLPMWGAVIDGTQRLETNHSFQRVKSLANPNFDRLGLKPAKDNPYAIISQNAGSQITAIRKVANAEVVRNIVITAIALKRYELRTHRFPATLQELTPDLLKAVPIDCLDGQPLRYRSKADGTYLLYSVGENGKDDGGNPSFQPENGVTYSSFDWQSPHALDWVWPQPASAAEVQQFYEQLASHPH